MSIQNLHKLFLLAGAVSTDSRKLIPGSIFFALKGENFDGNRFAIEAIEKACSYAIVDDPSLPLHKQLIQVPDVLSCLQELASFHRSTFKNPVIAITGSNGKTTSKELISAVLSRRLKVCATPGNLNNHIGVPLTLLSLADHDIAIIEMGANHIGEIASLSSIANPDYGIITNIGKAHLEGFGSPEGVIQAKSELYSHIAAKNGSVFIDSDNSLLTSIAETKNLKTIKYGSSKDSIVNAEITDSSNFLKAKIFFNKIPDILTIESNLVGDYNIKNLLAAACIGRFFGVDPSEIEAALNEYVPSNSRSQLIQTKRNKIVLDAYNANPSSMEGSIANFLSLKETLPKMLILGDMLELGEYSGSEHKAVISLLEKSNANTYFLVGPEFKKAAGSKNLNCFINVDELIEQLRLNPVSEHCILLKGSRGIKLEKLLDYI